MTVEEYNFYKLSIEVFIAITSFFIGGGVGIFIENKLKIVQKFKIKSVNKSKTQKASQGDNPNLTQIFGDNFGDLNQNNSGSNIKSAVSLPPCRDRILEKVKGLMHTYAIIGSFESRYRKAISDLNNHEARLAAAEYYSACLEIKDVLFDRNSYKTGVNQDARKEIEIFFMELDSFVKDSLNNIEQLNLIIRRFEDAFIKLSPYMIL